MAEPESAHGADLVDAAARAVAAPTKESPTGGPAPAGWGGAGAGLPPPRLPDRRFGETAPITAPPAAAAREPARGPEPIAHADPPGEAPPSNGARRTLHLSLTAGNGMAGSGDSPSTAAPKTTPPGPATTPRPFAQGPVGYAGTPPPHPAGGATRPGPPPYPVRPAMPGPETARPKEAGAFIDRSLRERISGDIEAFLAAFDAALEHDTAESRSGLREATDRLLRAGARTRIELERLEARVPLAPRDKDPRAAPQMRAR